MKISQRMGRKEKNKENSFRICCLCIGKTLYPPLWRGHPLKITSIALVLFGSTTEDAGVRKASGDLNPQILAGLPGLVKGA